MSKRSIIETLLDDDFEEIDPKDLVKEKKLKKKPTTTVTQVVGDVASGSTVGIFDEIMTFNDDQSEKLEKTIQISQTEGIGVTANTIYLLRITKKNGYPEISSFQFSIKNAVIPNLINALRNIYRTVNSEKK